MSTWNDFHRTNSNALLSNHGGKRYGRFKTQISVQTVAKRWEKVTLALGDFNALHIERLIGLQHQDFTRSCTIRWEHLWLVSDIGRWVARQLTGEYTTSGRRGGGREDHFRRELTAFF